MSSSLKKALRLPAIAAALMAVSLAFLPGSPGSGPYASTLDDPESATRVQTCENTKCNTACWVDGCQFNCGTRCKKTIMQLLECPEGTGGCLGEAC